MNITNSFKRVERVRPSSTYIDNNRFESLIRNRLSTDYRLDIDNDDHYWQAMETLPIGFVGGSKGRDHLSNILKGGSIDSGYILFVREELKRKMLMLESERWANGYPSDEIFDTVIEYVLVKHLRSIINIHFEMFTNVDPQSDDSIIKAYYSKQRMDKEMEVYRKFSSNTI